MLVMVHENSTNIAMHISTTGLLSLAQKGNDDSSCVNMNIADPEPAVVVLDEDEDPARRVGTALGCLTPYDSSQHWSCNSPPFLYWTIRDYAHAYRSKLTTPATVSFCP